MMSKNSFWDSIKENNKRRIWLWVVSWLLWVFVYPAGLILSCSMFKSNMRARGISLDGALAIREKNDMIMQYLDMGQGLWIFTVIMAIVAAIQGFSYLYSKKKIDFYHSMPVPASKRFFVITTNSFLIFAVPFTASLLLSCVIAAFQGVFSGELVVTVLNNVGLGLLLYLGIFGISAVAVMLTGNIVITGFAVLIFMFYELGLGALITQYQMDYYTYYSGMGKEQTLYLHPLFWYEMLSHEKAVMPVIMLTLQAVVFIGIAYFCYRKRPAEAAGKAMAFPVTKPIIKFMITIPTVLVVGGFISSMFWRRDRMEPDAVLIHLISMLVALILSNCVIEVIYEMDIRAAFHKKRQIIWSGLCVAVVFCVFRFDLFGYDRWIPKEEDLKDATVFINELVYANDYYEEDMTDLPPREYYERFIGFDDLSAVIELSNNKAPDWNQPNVASCEVGYKLANGRTVWRSFPIGEGGQEALNKVMQTPQFKEKLFQIYDAKLFENMAENMEITFDRGIGVDNLPKEDAAHLRELFLQDLEEYDFAMIRDEYPLGELNFKGRKKTVLYDGSNHEYSFGFGYMIYPSYSRVLSYLKDKGIYLDGYVNPDDVASITVTNYHYEEEDVYRSSAEKTGAYPVFESSATYQEAEEIKQILGSLYPESFPAAWKDEKLDSDISVQVQLKKNTGNSSYYRGSSSFRMMRDKMPAFIETDTAYK